VIALDPVRKAAVLAEGRELSYDACILAHGSSALAPAFHRDDLPGVHLLRSVGDADAILAEVASGTRVAVIGGGVLGVEAALGLARRGAAVSLLEWLPRLMPRQLDAAGADWLRERLEARGIICRTGVAVAELAGDDRVRAVRLDDGGRVDADLVLVSTGVQPNVGWVRRSGLRCGRGVLVDDRMASSAPDVYAAGDVAEWQGRVVGLWTNAIEQARVAAANAAGGMSFFEGFLPVTALKCADFPLTSIGEILEDGDGVTSQVDRDAAGSYRRLVLRNGIPVGAVLIGTAAGSGDLASLVQKGAELERLRSRLAAASTSAGVSA
jgi:nitrite reductase (NADH) large subunit